MTSRIPFLSSVLAEEGLYCVVGLKKGAPRQTFVETIEEIDGVVEGLIAQGYDAYFGCAKYLHAKEGRTAQNAKWFKADRKSTRLNSSHIPLSRMPSSA